MRDGCLGTCAACSFLRDLKIIDMLCKNGQDECYRFLTCHSWRSEIKGFGSCLNVEIVRTRRTQLTTDFE